MNIDKRNLFLDAVSLALAAATYTSDVMDLWGAAALGSGPVGTPLFDLGRGGDVDLLVQIVADFTSGGAATLQVQLINADAADLSGNPVVLWDSGAIAKATLVAGYRFRIAEIPAGCKQRYLGFKYIIAVAAGTGGAITAAIVYDADQAPGSMF